MFKHTALFLTCAIVFQLAHAQDRTENFKLILPESQVSNSLYNSISYRDVRRDTSSLGIVQLGAFNAGAKVVAREPLQNQLQKVVSNLAGPSAADGKLLFVVRRFTFKEITKSLSETGYFYIRGTLFAEDAGTYRIINDLDTIVEFNAMDVTQRLLRTGGKIIVDFIEQNLTIKPSGEQTFTYHTALQIDSVRKSIIPLYTAGSFKDGVYANYEEFKTQSPGIVSFSMVKKGKNIRKVYTKPESGEAAEINEDDIYVVVSEGNAYVATGYGFYPIQRRGDDFYYTGKIKSYNSGAAVMGAVLFGLAGALIAGSGSDIAHHKLDYMNGMFLFAGKVK